MEVNTDGSVNLGDLLENIRRENEELKRQLDDYKTIADAQKLLIDTYNSSSDIDKLNLELIKAKEAAESSSRLKSEFLAQISHEIRTPLNTILSFASLLRFELEDLLTEDLRDGFKIISNGGKRLIRTIDLILNMSEINAGSYDLQKSVFDLKKDVLDHLVLEFISAAQVKNLEFSMESTSLKTTIEADIYTATQIFMNLIDNAIKFTNSGSVKIKIYDNIDGNLCVEVADTGIGISEEYLKQLFTPFSQEDTGYTRKYEGNGLGLALVKKCCELNNAEIKVETKKGKGSKFTVVF